MKCIIKSNKKIVVKIQLANKLFITKMNNYDTIIFRNRFIDSRIYDFDIYNCNFAKKQFNR